MSLLVYAAPTNVSFYRVRFMEALANATSITGYYATWYTNVATLMDNDANIWFQLNADNSWPHVAGSKGNNYDQAFWHGDRPPWAGGGGFSWAYSPKWMVGTNGKTNDVQIPWTQQMTLGSDGAMTIQKYGHTVTRNTNDIYTTEQ